jgi:hypothetical protein
MSEKTEVPWKARARNLLKGELAKRGIKYTDLAVRLKQLDVHDSPENLRIKISRGTFSAAFMLQVLHVIGCKTFEVFVE